MKRTLILLWSLAALAGLAVAQCPQCQGMAGGPMQGGTIEKREIIMQGGPDTGMRGPGMGKGMHRPWWKNPELVKELALTDKQLGDIESLSLKHRKDMIKLKADLELLKVDMQQLMDANGSDSDIRDQSKKMFGLREKMHDAMMEHMLAVRKVLTAEQQKKLKDLKGAMRHGQMLKMDCPDRDPDGK